MQLLMQPDLEWGSSQGSDMDMLHENLGCAVVEVSMECMDLDNLEAFDLDMDMPASPLLEGMWSHMEVPCC